MKQSIWTNGVQIRQFPQLDGDLKTDVLVVGGGLAGLLCAWQLQKSGVDCVLIEADRIFRGVSANTTAKITSQHGLIYTKLIREFDADTARGYYEANERAIREYRALAENCGCDFETKDNYIYSTGLRSELEEELTALQRIGARADFRMDVPLPVTVSGAIRFPDQAQFNPVKLAAELSKKLRIYEHTAAREFAANRVKTDRGMITASKIIVATHFPILNKHGSYFLKMHQQRSYLMALENAPDVGGMYLDGAENGLSFRNYGKYLLIGGGGHRTGKQGGGWDELERFRQLHYPQAREVCRWAAQDCMTLDGVPYIGSYSRRTPELYVATGFNKWGMSSAMVSAMILSDLVQGRENPYSEVFDPSRTMLRPKLVSNALESAWNLLTPTTPRCPHLGCALKWNRAEHSWDCSCHGSRFSEDGTLLDNPATRNANIGKEKS